MASMIRSVPVALAVFGLSLVGLGVLGASCGPSTVSCQPSNCSGCCSEAGECLGPAKQTSMACGTGTAGQTCRVCLPDQFCSQGRCVRDPDAGLGGGEGGGAGGGTGGGGAGGGTGGGTGGGGACGARGQGCCNGTDCLLGLTCQRGLCDSPPTDAGSCGGQSQVCCGGASPCNAPLTCQSGLCQSPPPDAGSPKRTGEPCQLSSECLDGLCQVFGFQGGYCTKACTTSTECLAGSQCGWNPAGTGPAKLCLAQCGQAGQAPGGCRAAYVCDRNADTSGVPVCLPSCVSISMCRTEPTCDSRGFCCGTTGAACCEGATCQGGSTCMNGYCQAASCGGVGQPCCTSGPQCGAQSVCVSGTCQACGVVGQPCCSGSSCSAGTCISGTCQNQSLSATGAACTSPATCQGNMCLAEGAGVWTGGYCSQRCESSACASGSNCSPWVISGMSVCVAACAYDGGVSTCRAGYVCDRGLIPGNAAQGSCNTACTSNTNCPTNRCENGFCCGAQGFRCCAGATPCPGGGTCGSLGYCQ